MTLSYVVKKIGYHVIFSFNSSVSLCAMKHCSQSALFEVFYCGKFLKIAGGCSWFLSGIMKFPRIADLEQIGLGY